MNCKGHEIKIGRGRSETFEKGETIVEDGGREK